MKKSSVIRAWRDRNFRDAMKDSEAVKTANPAGIAELDERFLSSIGGATNGCGSGGTISAGGGGSVCRYCQN
jgi:mersacidin/lichenicidin family type 2 lantibiotic